MICLYTTFDKLKKLVVFMSTKKALSKIGLLMIKEKSPCPTPPIMYVTPGSDTVKN